MKKQEWSTFSFTELLTPPEGWKTETAVLSTYSADLVVVITSLLALTGCDLDARRKPSLVELINAVESLRGKVRVLAQTGRVVAPKARRPILKVLDKFVKTINTDESLRSFHPKAALVRYARAQDPVDRQWRLWLGSRNLTKALNWDAGILLVSRSDDQGQRIEGLPRVGREFATLANLPVLAPEIVEAELEHLTWECPPGCEVHRISLLGSGMAKGFPKPPSDTDRMFVVSPFLDAETVREAAGWGGTKTRRTIVSTHEELQRLLHEDKNVFAGFESLRIQPFPDLPAEGSETLEEDAAEGAVAEDEQVVPEGLHAKLLFASKGSRRQLWLGSANATERGWQGRNTEIVAEISVSRDVADGIEDFVATCETFNPRSGTPRIDEDERALEIARRSLSGCWSLRQISREDALSIKASSRPPIGDPVIVLYVAPLGASWTEWPRENIELTLPALHGRERSDFLQLRVVRGDRMCAWLQIAPCEPPPDEQRDHGLIAQYLEPSTFLWWLRSVLADTPPQEGGGDWDDDPDCNRRRLTGTDRPDIGVLPTIEEILRAWSRDASAFAHADLKVSNYLVEMERRAEETRSVANFTLLRTFRDTWEAIAKELR